LTLKCLGDNNKEAAMSGTRSTQARNEKCIKIFSVKSEGPLGKPWEGRKITSVI
jgi:hypothetical protein